MTDVRIHLCFVRHAETEANSLGIRQGHSDYPLTAKGVAGAERVGCALRSIPWDLMVCSDLPRTQKTFALLKGQREHQNENNLEIITEIVREINFGIREGLHRDVTVEEAKNQLSAKLGVTPESIVDTGESEDQVYQRQKAFLVQLRKSLADHAMKEVPAKVLCVSHGGFIKKFLANFTCEKVEAVPNCSITTVHMSFAQDEESIPECQVVSICETNHLNGLSSDPISPVEEYLWPS